MIENTSRRDPFVHMAGMSGGTSSYIEEMEADGQRQVVASEQMPSRAPIAELEALGFVFGPVDDRDPLFRPVQLPAGWSRQGTDHSMHSYIVDDRGRPRVSIFYKAAFYDRKASASLVAATAPLDGLLYSDDVPTAVELDELLTAEQAVDWITAQRRYEQDHLDIVAPNGPMPDRSRHHLERLDVIEQLVKAAAAR